MHRVFLYGVALVSFDKLTACPYDSALMGFSELDAKPDAKSGKDGCDQSAACSLTLACTFITENAR
jgi:hypothetical protein